MNAKKSVFIILSILIILLLVFTLFSFTLKPKDLNVNIYNGEELLLSESYKIDHKFSLKLFFYHKNKLSVYLSNNQKDIAILKNLNERLYEDVKDIIDKNQAPFKNASAEFNLEQKFTYVEEENGYLIDQNDLLGQILSDNDSKNIKLKKITLYPDISVDDLKERTKLIGSFTTDYSSSSESRKHNIKLAAEKFNGKVFMPNEIISFNAVVGKRTLENGFLESVIINQGQFTKGVGGGVCQVSTTLYNALLYSDLKIEHATAHSLPISYVPKSFDAMVSSSNDLSASNSTPYPVFIGVTADGNKVTFNIYGYRADDLEIRLRSELIKTVETNEYDIIKETDGDIFSDSKILSLPKCGYKTKGYKDYYFNGVLYKSNLLREDYYMPQKGKMLFYNKKTENLPLSV